MKGLPHKTRILVVPEDDRPSREFSLSRNLLVIGIFLAVIFVLGFAGSLAGLFVLAGRLSEVADLRRDLDQARSRLASLSAIDQELEEMRSLEERLLVMLGVQPPGTGDQDTLGAWPTAEEAESLSSAERLSRAAALVFTPPPDLWPVAGFVTREFVAGDTQHGILPHHGIDIAGPEGSPLKAAGKGRVSRARWDDFLGNFVEIQHGFGYVTVYGHCNELRVVEGDRVDRGQEIGTLGGTGQATAPHLHFEVWKEGVAVDPRTVFEGDPPR